MLHSPEGKRISKYHLLWWPRPPALVSYGIAVLSVAAALAIALLLEIYLVTAPSSLFLCAIMLSAWFGGNRPGLFAVVLSLLAFDYFFVGPIDSFAMEIKEVPRFIIFMLVAIFVGSMSAAQKNTADSLSDARDDLTRTVQELRGTNEALQAENAERQRAEETNRRLAAIFESTDDAVFSSSLEGIITSWNKGAERMYGYRADEVMGRHKSVLIPGDHADDISNIIDPARLEESIRLETVRVRKDGQRIDVALTISAIKDSEGHTVGASVIARDITERKRIEEQQSRLARHTLLRAEISAAFNESEGSLRGILQECAESVVRHLDAAFARIWTLHDDKSPLELQASAGLYTHLDGMHARIPVGSLKIGLIAAERKPHLTNSVLEDERISDKEWARREGLISFAGYPLEVKGKTVGVIAMFARYALEQSTIDVLESIAPIIAQGIERTRAEEALRRSEADLAEAQRLSHTGSFGWNVSTGEIHWSEETFRLYQYDPTVKPTMELIQQRVHPDDVAVVEQTVESASQGQKDFDFEHRLLMPDGSVKYLHAVAHASRDESGSLEFVGALMDITVAKQTEASLWEQASLLNLTHDTILVRDMNDVITYWNRGAEGLYGWTKEEALGKVTHELLRTVFPVPIDEIRAELLRTGRWEGELLHSKSDGTQVVVASRWSLQRDDQQRPLAVLETNNDITERKLAEAALRDREAKYRYIFQSTGVSIWEEDFSRVKIAIDDLKASGVIDFRQYFANHPEFAQQAITMVKVVDVNDVSVMLFAAESKDELLVSLQNVFMPETQEVFVGALIAIAEGRTSFEAETVLQTLKGERLTVLLTITFPTQPDGFDRVLVTCTDITERKRAEEALRQQANLLEQTHDAILMWEFPQTILFWNRGAEQLYGFSKEEALGRSSHELLHTEHPLPMSDFEAVLEREGSWTGELTHTTRDGRKILVESRHVLMREADGRRLVLETNNDITERKLAEAALRESEQQWRDVFENNPTMYFMVDAWGTIMAVNPFGAEQLGYTVTELVGQPVLRVIYEYDREAVQRNVALCLKQLGKSMNWEARKVRKDGSVLWVRETARAVVRANDRVVLIACEDITERKTAEEKIRQQELELRQLIDLTPQHVAVLGSDRRRLFSEGSPNINQAALDYHGLTLEEWQSSDPRRFFHPDDWERMMREDQSKFERGLPYESEARLLRHDGVYRWFLFRHNPMRDEQGRISRWYVAATDIEDRKQAEQRLHNENIALREEIDTASMFEEIVGTSPALQAVLARVAQVAPTDSTVLITGETGTGKELIARAIHKLSKRSARAFISVNCAAIPPSLVASELFGHEKGAFTGAFQRRLGRFELAECGTIFLDEIGELPAETQSALLRVLQEHEFERVGGNRSIRTDVRVIVATNRDLQAAMAAGTFRTDLFYRLNVFPIEMPPLRERREDIVMLVGYFIDRFARNAGKTIRSINKRTLELLQSYSWPGNIRELQNVVERAVIVCEGENFSIDESWLAQQSAQAQEMSQALSKKSAADVRATIEAALAETRGRVSGPSGAAARLGVPPSTLESKIKALKINKNRFKSSHSATA